MRFAKPPTLFRAGLARNRERGVILILVTLVLAILIAVVSQIWFSAEVDKQVAIYQKTVFPVRQAAQGAFMKACSILLQDLQSQESGDEEDEGGEEGDGTEGDGEGEGDGSGGDGGSGGLGGGSGSGGGDGGLFGGEETGQGYTDSLIDSWARPGEIAMAFSSNVEVNILIRDEDAKFNILSILSKDEEFQEKSMERLVRVIDLFREGMKGDLSHGDARDIAGALKDWMSGERKDLHFPKPLVKSGKEDKEDDLDSDDSIDYPLTMEELLMCDDITTDILFGYIDNKVRIPGLIEYVTVYSNLIFDEPKGDEEEGEDGSTGSDPFASDEEDAYQDTPDDEDGEGGDQEVAVETNNGLINVNTAPLSVLKSLLDDNDLPYSVIDQLGEYRDRAVQKYLDEIEDLDWEDRYRRSNLFSKDDKDDEDDEDEDDDSDDLDEDEEEDFIFKDPYAVFEQVEEYLDTEFKTEEDAENEFLSLISVNSNVFTIYIILKTTDGRDETCYRAVVWRRGGGGGSTEEGVYTTTSSEEGQIVTLVPLELYAHPIPYREGEKEELASYYE